MASEGRSLASGHRSDDDATGVALDQVEAGVLLSIVTDTDSSENSGDFLLPDNHYTDADDNSLTENARDRLQVDIALNDWSYDDDDYIEDFVSQNLDTGNENDQKSPKQVVDESVLAEEGNLADMDHDVTLTMGGDSDNDSLSPKIGADSCIYCLYGFKKAELIGLNLTCRHQGT